MVNVIFRGKKIVSLEQEAIKRLKQSCLKKQIIYMEDSNNNLILFPVFGNKTIIIRVLTNDQELLDFAQLLKQKLLLSGAEVIIDQQINNRKGVLKLSDDQLVLCLNRNLGISDEVVLYSSFRKTTNFDHFVKSITKYFVQESPGVSFDIASIWKKIINFKYWRYLFFTYTPTLLIEFGNTEMATSLKEKFCQWLLDGYIQCYSEVYTPDQILTVNKLLEDLAEFDQLEQEKVRVEKQITEASNNFKELLEKLEHKEAEVKKLLLSKIDSPEKQTEEKQTRESEEKLNTPTPAQTKSSRKAKPIVKGAVLNKGRKISKNITQYPFLPPSDCQVYQFSRATSANEESTIPSYYMLKQSSNPDMSQTENITENTDYTSKENDNVIISEEKQTQDSDIVEESKPKTDLQETESLKLETALKNFKQINQAEQE